MSRQCPSCYIWESRGQEESIRPLFDQVSGQLNCTMAHSQDSAQKAQMQLIISA